MVFEIFEENRNNSSDQPKASLSRISSKIFHRKLVREKTRAGTTGGCNRMFLVSEADTTRQLRKEKLNVREKHTRMRMLFSCKPMLQLAD